MSRRQRRITAVVGIAATWVMMRAVRLLQARDRARLEEGEPVEAMVEALTRSANPEVAATYRARVYVRPDGFFDVEVPERVFAESKHITGCCPDIRIRFMPPIVRAGSFLGRV